MTASVIFSIAAVFAIWGLYSYMDYRMEKRQWKGKTKVALDAPKRRKSFIVVWGEKFDQSDRGHKLQRKLREINLHLTPSEYVSMFILGGLILFFFSNNFLKFPMHISILIGVAGSYGINRLLFLIRRNKLEEKMNEQLSEVCATLSNATRSGMTITQGIQLVADEISEPSKSEFQRLANELSLGVDFEEALLKFQKRFKSREFTIFVVTLITQKKSGGNIHDTLEEMAHVLDERQFLEQEIKTLTSEQRFVSYIIPAIPIMLVLGINLMMEGYLNVLFSGLGIFLLIIFVLGTGLSFVLVRKVTNIRV